MFFFFFFSVVRPLSLSLTATGNSYTQRMLIPHQGLVFGEWNCPFSPPCLLTLPRGSKKMARPNSSERFLQIDSFLPTFQALGTATHPLVPSSLFSKKADFPLSFPFRRQVRALPQTGPGPSLMTSCFRVWQGIFGLLQDVPLPLTLQWGPFTRSFKQHLDFLA